MRRFSYVIGILVLCATQQAHAKELPISTAPEHQLRPAIASSGNNYLVVWQDNRSVGTGTDIWGRTVTINGDPLDSFPICTQTDLQAFPAVTWGGDNYFVIWEDCRQRIYGQLVDESGNLVGSRCLIGEDLNMTQEMGNDVASNGSNYLVVWTESPLDIAGRTVSSAGVPIGSAFTICSAADSQMFPRVTSAGSNYLVAWTDLRTGNWDIYGQKVDSSGSLMGGNFSISSETRPEKRLALASQDSCILVAWERDNGIIIGFDIRGSILDTAMNVLHDNITICGAMWDQRLSCACWHSASSQFLVGWHDYRDGGTANIWIRGTKVDGTFDPEYQITSLPVEQREPDIACSRICFLIVWEDYREGASNIDIYGYIPPPCPVEERERAENRKLKAEKLQIYPNPCTQVSGVRFDLPALPDGREQAGVLGTNSSHLTPLTLKIYDLGGRLVRSLQISKSPQPEADPPRAENQQISKSYWDGKDSNGIEVLPGTYFVRLSGSPRSVQKLIKL